MCSFSRASDVSVQQGWLSGKRCTLGIAIRGEGDVRLAIEIDRKDKARGTDPR